MKRVILISCGLGCGCAFPALGDSERHDSWAGAYIGVTAGGAEVEVDGTWDPGDITGPFDIDTLSGTGSSLQFVAGYNFETDSNIVYGIEADYGGLHFDDDMGNGGARFDGDKLGSVRVRAGIHRDHFMYYATVGWAWLDYDISSRGTSAAGSQSFTADGPVIGIGTEVTISPHARLRGELTYYGFNDTQSLGGFPDTSANDYVTVDDITALRVSLTFHR